MVEPSRLNHRVCARAIVREQGKTIAGIGARYEVQGCVGWLRATAGTPLPREVLIDDGATYAEMHYRPVGTVGAITPWNWPLIIATWQVAPSLRMGNTVVQKPSEYTTLCNLALIEVLNEVLPDVDPEKIAEGLFWGAFINNGQTCAALKRLYVPHPFC